MNTTFKLVFKLSAFHSYFPNNVCPSLTFTPSAQTVGIFQRYGFKIRTTQNGMEVYANTPSSLADFLKYLESTHNVSDFVFNIQTTDPGFIAMTDLPVKWQGQIHYSSGDDANKSEGDQIELHPTLSYSGGGSVLGSIVINFADLIAANAEPPAYALRFSSRSTQWQYYIFNQSNMSLNKPVIISTSDIEFSGPENATLPNGQQALLFTSTKLIPLRQIPEHQVDLVDQEPTSTGNQKTIFKGLPHPDPAQMIIVQIDDEEAIASPMYIYL